MKNTSISLISLVSLATAGACAGLDAPAGDVPFEDGAVDLGKADAVGLALTPIVAEIAPDRLEEGGTVVITSAESWQDYFGTAAPAAVDFDRQWVAFYGAGLRNTGGFSAEILAIHALPGSGGLVLETHHTSPGADCIVTQALTWPHALVAFDAPSPAPTWAAANHSEETRGCSGSGDRQLALAESRETWEAARDGAGASYTYSQVMSSWIGLQVTTTFVIEAGEVVERHYESRIGAEVTSWSELGDEVGLRTDEGHAVALVDDLYEICASEVLTVDEDEHFIHLAFDDAGLLQTCTATHKLCQDDCDRGPKIGFIQL
jgi:hypothetical protein